MDGKAGQWGVAAASGGVVLCIVALALWWRMQTPTPSALAPPPPVESAASAGLPASEPPPPRPPETPAPIAQLPAPEAPLADVVRIRPNGDVLVAGRAEPGAHVTLLDNGQALMAEDVNPKTGEFVFLPPRLSAGAHQLALRGEPAGGGPSLQRDLTAFTIAPAAKGEAPPATAPAAAAPPSETAAAPSVSPAQAAVGREAKTIARGDTLWRISRQKLGRGSLYRSIFQANTGKIHDPNLIYPGQSLDIPPRD